MMLKGETDWLEHWATSRVMQTQRERTVAEVGKVTSKSNGDEALSDESL
jgi:hypothetical protein